MIDSLPGCLFFFFLYWSYRLKLLLFFFYFAITFNNSLCVCLLHSWFYSLLSKSLTWQLKRVGWGRHFRNTSITYEYILGRIIKGSWKTWACLYWLLSRVCKCAALKIQTNKTDSQMISFFFFFFFPYVSREGGEFWPGSFKINVHHSWPSAHLPIARDSLGSRWLCTVLHQIKWVHLAGQNKYTALKVFVVLIWFKTLAVD